MGKSYKEELAAFKQARLDPEKARRIYPRRKKVKPYKVIGVIGTSFPFWCNTEIVIGRYATPNDARKAMKAASQYTFYCEIKCDPPID